MNVRRFFELTARHRDRHRPSARDVARYARNRLLQPVGHLAAQRLRRDDLPIVFIVGAPRSGSTMLLQLLTAYFDVAWIPNAASTWWVSPVLGLALHLRRHGALQPPEALESSHGRTRGPHGTSELGWFWTFYLDRSADDEPTEPGRAQLAAIARQLEGVVGLTGRPLVVKNLNFTDFHVPALARALPSARFLWLRRDPRAVVQSVLGARERAVGDRRAWWSMRPPGASRWAGLSAERQVVRQVAAIEEALERDLGGLEPERWCATRYEDLLERTRDELATLGTRLRLPPRPAATIPTPQYEGGSHSGRKVDERILEALEEVGLDV